MLVKEEHGLSGKADSVSSGKEVRDYKKLSSGCGLALYPRCELDVLFGRPCLTRVKHTVAHSLSAEVTESLNQRKTLYIFIPPAGEVHALPLYRVEGEV